MVFIVEKQIAKLYLLFALIKKLNINSITGVLLIERQIFETFKVWALNFGLAWLAGQLLSNMNMLSRWVK